MELIPTPETSRWKTPSGTAWSVHRWEADNPSLETSRTPVVFLHGFSGSGLDAEALVATLGQNRIWIAPDLPGHGGTIDLGSDAEYRGETMASNVAALCRTLSRHPLLVGYSMGGRLAILTAVEAFPDLAGLVLIGCGAGLADRSERSARAQKDQALADRIEREGTDAFARFWETLPIILTQEDIPTPWGERIRERRRQHHPAELARNLRQFGQGVAPPLPGGWGRLDLPVWHLSGEKDLTYRSKGKRLLNGLSRGLVTVIPRAGHAAHLENLDETNVKFRRIFENIDDFGPLAPFFT